MNDCIKCKLHSTRKNIVWGEGPRNAEIVLLGEAPGQDEDYLGKPFVGRAGKLLDKILKEAGFDRKEIFIDNVCKCRPTITYNDTIENRPPSAEEIEACSSYFEETINNIKPKIIIAAGNTPLKYLLSNRAVNISKKRGQFIWSNKYQCYIVPVFHPAAILRKFEYYPITVDDFKKIQSFLKGEIKKLPTSYYFLDTKSKIESFFTDLSSQKVFSFDIETDNLDFLKSKIICMSFSWKEGEGYVLPILKEDCTSFWDNDTYSFIFDNLKNIFKTDAIKCYHNGKFDSLFLKNHGIEIYPPTFDTMLAHHLLDENAEGMHGLKSLAWIYTDMGGYEQNLEDYKKIHKLGKGMSNIPYSILYNYAAADADCTFRLYKIFLPLLEKEDLLKLFTKLVMPLNNILIETEFKGVKIDVDYLDQLDKKFTSQLEDIQQAILQKIGKEVNLNSTKQLQQLFFTDLKLPYTKKTKTGYSTDEEALTFLSQYHEVPKLILEYRRINKILSTYIKGLTYDHNHRVHTCYNLSGTQTGRLSSYGPNLQNIPHESEIKNIFIAEEGHSLIEADFSQIEFRLWGHYSNDEKMIADICKGLDIHKLVASKVFNIPMEQVTKEQRRLAKETVFGLLYGRGAKSIAEDNKISLDQARKIMHEFFSLYPKAKRWLDLIVIQAKKDKKLKNFFGRIRRFVTFDSPDEEIRAQAERQAKNFLPQSTAADITNFTAVRLYPILKKYNAVLVLNVHDCLVYEVPDQYVDEVAAIIKREAERKIKGLNVPLEVEIKISKKWGS